MVLYLLLRPEILILYGRHLLRYRCQEKISNSGISSSETMQTFYHMGLTTVHPLPVKTNRSIGFFLRHPGVYSKVKRPNELSPTTVMVAGSISLLLIVSSVLALTAMHHTACVFLQHPVLRGSACAQSGNPAARPLSGMHTFHQRNTICSNPH